MKFTKLTSSVLAGATLLSILAPTATFAATLDQGTAEENIAANGGNGATALPMGGGHDTVAGISFGKTDPNGNKGFLRLQYVPYVLDFGNHMVYNGQFNEFDATGINLENPTNTANVGYQGNKDTEQTNKTDTYNFGAKLTGATDLNPKADGTNRSAWVTVVDKQHMALDDQGVSTVAGNDGINGTWDVAVKSNDVLKGQEEIQGAVLSLNNTKFSNTQEVQTLTNEDQDADYKVVAPTAVKPENNIVIPLDAAGAGTSSTAKEGADGTGFIKVAHADAKQGAGADIFSWKHEDIKLTLPSNATVHNGVYEAHLSWVLSTGVTK